jgi:hypothetical protein
VVSARMRRESTIAPYADGYADESTRGTPSWVLWTVALATCGRMVRLQSAMLWRARKESASWVDHLEAAEQHPLNPQADILQRRWVSCRCLNSADDQPLLGQDRSPPRQRLLCKIPEGKRLKLAFQERCRENPERGDPLRSSTYTCILAVEQRICLSHQSRDTPAPAGAVLRVQNPVQRVANLVAVVAEVSKLRYISEVGKRAALTAMTGLPADSPFASMTVSVDERPISVNMGALRGKQAGTHRGDTGGFGQDAQGRGGKNERR